MAVTSYGRNKKRDDEIKKTMRRPIIAPAIAVRLLKKDILHSGQRTESSRRSRTWGLKQTEKRRDKMDSI